MIIAGVKQNYDAMAVEVPNGHQGLRRCKTREHNNSGEEVKLITCINGHECVRRRVRGERRDKRGVRGGERSSVHHGKSPSSLGL